MGIRVNKILGYGLTDVKTHEYEISDPRINDNSMMFGDGKLNDFILYQEEIIASHSLSEFDELMIEFAIAHGIQKNKESPLSTCMHYDFEYGIDSVICFVVPSDIDTYVRHDDPIDYYEELVQQKKIAEQGFLVNDMTTCRILDDPIYPYIGYMDNRTGKRLTMEEETLMRDFKEYPDLLKRINTHNKITASYGVASTEYLKHTTPILPDELITFLKYTKVFHDDSTIFQLRPMIYTLWA